MGGERERAHNGRKKRLSDSLTVVQTALTNDDLHTFIDPLYLLSPISTTIHTQTIAHKVASCTVL